MGLTQQLRRTLPWTWQIRPGGLALEAIFVHRSAAHLWQLQAQERVAFVVANPERFYADHAVCICGGGADPDNQKGRRTTDRTNDIAADLQSYSTRRDWLGVCGSHRLKMSQFCASRDA